MKFNIELSDEAVVLIEKMAERHKISFEEQTFAYLARGALVNLHDVRIEDPVVAQLMINRVGIGTINDLLKASEIDGGVHG